MNDEFEQRLSRQPVKEIPSAWRAEILAAAQPDSRRAPRVSFFLTLNPQLSTLFWPHPKAWAGLAAVWIFIFAVNFSIRDKTPVVAEKSLPPSPEVMAELKREQRMYAELIGANDLHVADRQKVFPPRPRSEREEFLTA